MARRDPEPALGMVNEGDGMPIGGTHGPAATEEVSLVVGVGFMIHNQQRLGRVRHFRGRCRSRRNVVQCVHTFDELMIALTSDVAPGISP